MMIMAVEPVSFNGQQGAITDCMKQIGDRVLRIRKSLGHILTPANIEERSARFGAKISPPSQGLFAAAVSKYVGYEVHTGIVGRLEQGLNLPSNLGIYKYLNHLGYSLDHILFDREPQKTELTPLATQMLFVDLEVEDQIDLAVKLLYEISLKKENSYRYLADFLMQLLSRPVDSATTLPRPDEVDRFRVDLFRMGKRLRIARGHMTPEQWSRSANDKISANNLLSPSTVKRRENEGMCVSSLDEFRFYSTLDTNLDYLVLGKRPNSYPKSRVLICDAISKLDSADQEFLFRTVLPELLSVSDRQAYIIRLQIQLGRIVDLMN